MIAIAYLLSLLVAVAALAVTLRPRPVPAPPTNPPALPAAADLPAGAEAEIRLILVTAAHLAARLVPAA
ncbi:hypothetical protein ACFYWO_39900 [Streptomyces sp. NPDC002932]|uniref:hypothetical protein n=1 Tax=Streptomyces sp. NPDC002932 TaxID=3364672 RepID=UPI003686B37F